VTLSPSGSGTVAVTLVLDRQAVAVVGDHVGVSDLRAQGWSVTGPARAQGGSEALTVAHPFRDPGEATALLSRLGEPWHLTVTRGQGTFHSSVGVHGSVDLRGGIDALAGAIAGLPAGSAAALAAVARSGGTVPAFSVQLVVSLPGPPSHVAGPARLSGTTATWDLPIGQDVVVAVSSRRADAAAERWLAAAGVLALAFVAVIAVESVLVRRRAAGPRVGDGPA
jgi:hypothetical protein